MMYLDTGNIAFYNDLTAKVSVEGEICSNPESRSAGQYFVLCSRKIHAGQLNQAVSGRILVKQKSYPQYFFGQKISLKGQLQKPAVFDTFSYADYLANDDVYTVSYNAQITVLSQPEPGFWVAFFGLKNLIRAKIEDLYSEPTASIALGLLLGMRSSIPQNILDDFKNVGLTHILAISGYNITLIISIVAGLLQKRSRKMRFTMTILALLVFAVLTGLSTSVVRASIMGSLVVFANFIGRKSNALQVLLMSGFLMILLNPRILIHDISFQLSFLSTMGLLVLLPLWENYFKKLPAIIGESLSVTMAAIVFTTPITLLNFGQFSLVAPVANILFLPFVPLIMMSSFFGLAASVLFFPLKYVFIAVTWFLTYLLLAGVSLVAKIPFALLQVKFFNGFVFVGYYLALFALIMVLRKPKSCRAFYLQAK